MLVNIEDVSSKTVPRKKKQTVFQRVYAVVTTSKPKRGANVAGRPWIVTFRNVSVEGKVVRARRSSHERRQCARCARVCLSGPRLSCFFAGGILSEGRRPVCERV